MQVWTQITRKNAGYKEMTMRGKNKKAENILTGILTLFLLTWLSYTNPSLLITFLSCCVFGFFGVAGAVVINLVSSQENRFVKYFFNIIWSGVILWVVAYFLIFTGERFALVSTEDKYLFVGFTAFIATLFTIPLQLMFFQAAHLFESYANRLIRKKG